MSWLLCPGLQTHKTCHSYFANDSESTICCSRDNAVGVYARVTVAVATAAVAIVAVVATVVVLVVVVVEVRTVVVVVLVVVVGYIATSTVSSAILRLPLYHLLQLLDG